MDVKVKNKRFNPYFKEFSGLEVGQMREIIAYMFSLML